MDRRRIFIIVAAIVAVLGVALVYVYVRGSNNRASQKFETVNVLGVVGTPITQGESIADAQTNGQIAVLKVARNQLLAGAVTSTSQLTGEFANTEIYPGEQLVIQKFGATAAASSVLQIPKDELATAYSLTDPGRVAGFVNPGSEVAIFQTCGTYSRLLLPRVLVLGVGSTAQTTTTTTDATGAVTTEALPGTLMTLALNQVDTQKMLLAVTTCGSSKANAAPTSGSVLSFGLLPANELQDRKVGAPIEPQLSTPPATALNLFR